VADQGAEVEPEQQIFTAPRQGAHGPAAQGFVQIGGDRPAQASIAHAGAENALVFQVGRQSPAHGFDFGQFGHDDGFN
jgi:hypothetical protein